MPGHPGPGGERGPSGAVGPTVSHKTQGRCGNLLSYLYMYNQSDTLLWVAFSWNECSGSFAQIKTATVFLTGSARKQRGTRREGEFMGMGWLCISIKNSTCTGTWEGPIGTSVRTGELYCSVQRSCCVDLCAWGCPTGRTSIHGYDLPTGHAGLWAARAQ